MKKIIACFLVFALSVVLVTGCGKKEVETNEPTPSIEVSPSPESASPEASPEASPQAEQKEEQSKPVNNQKEPESKPVVNQKPEQPQQTETPTATPTPEPKPELTAAQVASRMVGAMDSSTHNLSEMPSDLYSGVYGIDPASFSSVAVYGTMINVKSNEIIVIKAGGNIAAAKAALQNRKNTLLEQWKHYLPDQYELVQKGVIETRGDYVVLVIADDQASALSAFRAAV